MPSLPSPITIVTHRLVSDELRAQAFAQFGLLSAEQLLGRGITATMASDAVRSGHIRRPTRGVYDFAVEAPVDLDPSTRGCRAAVLGLLAYGPHSVAVGASSLALRGVWGLRIGHAPQIALPRGSARAPRAGISVRYFDPGTEVDIGLGWRCEGVVAALAHTLLQETPPRALGILDSALHRGLIEPHQVADVRARTARRRGCRALEAIWDMADKRRESPPESWAYYDLTVAGLTPDDIQVKIFDDEGQLIARGDIGYLLPDGNWLLIEIDGIDVHRAPEAVFGDRTRQNSLILNSTTPMLRYTTRDFGDVGRMVREVRTYLRRVRALPVAMSPSPGLLVKTGRH